MRKSPFDRSRPPWWPEGDQWQGRPGHRRFVGPFIAAAVLTLIGFGALISAAFHRPWLLWPLGIAAVILFARFGRARYFPVGRLIEASSKLAAGDYTVRVPEVEGGPMGRIVTSFNGMAERLEQSSEQRRRLLADLGHELRTPLTVIQGELEAMSDGVHPLNQSQIEMLLDETRLLGRLVDDLRVLSLTEAGELRLEKEAVEASALVEDAVAPYLSTASRANIEVQTKADKGLIVVDPFRIHEVLANLMTNALRHTSTGGKVEVSANRSHGGWMFSVQDTGSGIPADSLPHIFERFTKGGDSRGTGLGLSIARDLIRAHGGEMTASSKEGSGTVVEFSIPDSEAS